MSAESLASNEAPSQEPSQKSLEELKHALRTRDRRKVAIFKFGGTTSGSAVEQSRLKEARLLIEQKIGEGYFAIPVFSAFKRLGDGRAPKIGVTDLLLSYRDVIGAALTEKEGVQEFKRQLLMPHLDQMKDLELLGEEVDEEAFWQSKFGDVSKTTRKMLEAFRNELNAIVGDAATFNKIIPGQGAIDHFVSGGERLMVYIVSAYFNKKWLENKFCWRAEPVTAREIGVMTDGNFGNATILDESLPLVYKNLNRYWKQEIIPIVTGFDGVFRTEDTGGRERQYTTTLGRSGTDLTATYIGYAMRAEATYLVKDTPGVLTADPRHVPGARTIPHLSYELAVEAGNIMSKAVQPAMDGEMDLIVMDPATPEIYTKIGPERCSSGPILITNPEACRYARIDLRGRITFDKFYDELRRYKTHLFELYYTGDHVSFIAKGKKLPRALEHFLVREAETQLEEISAWFFQVVGYMSREDVVNFNAWLAGQQHLSGPRWFEESKSMNVCLPAEGTDISATLSEIHNKFIKSE